MRIALVQLNDSDNPAENLAATSGYIREAAERGADFILTPEVTNIISASRSHQESELRPEESDPTLAAIRSQARELGRWILIGSLALKTGDPDGRFANRSFLVGPGGEVAARYDKIHMFDVQITESESYRESASFRPGERMVVADAGFAKIGMTVCYDVRFPHLYRKLAHAGAEVITVPAAFSPVTGEAHWEPLLRARAIETGCYVLAPAQCGEHAVSRGKPRSTHGHSLAVDPWGKVICEAGNDPGVYLADIDLGLVAESRRRVPSLSHDREFAAGA